MALGAVVCLALGVTVGGLIWAGDESGATPTASERAPAPVPTPSPLIDAEGSREFTSANGDLYVLESKRGWVERVSDTAWDLSLHEPRVVWFADRPSRESGPLAAGELVSRWEELFAGVPPNGAIVAPDGPDGERPTALVVTNPKLDDGVVSFRISGDDDAEAAAAWLSALEGAGERSGVALFLDDSDLTLTVYGNFVSSFKWRPDLSQCAAYGNSWETDAPGVFGVAYTYKSSGSCFSDPTYARFDVYDLKDSRVGTVTFTGEGDGCSTSVAAITCDYVKMDSANQNYFHVTVPDTTGG